MTHSSSAPAESGSAADARQDRLARILDAYLIAVERGEHIAPEDLLRQHPEEATELRGYLSGLELFHKLVARQTTSEAQSRGELSRPLRGALGDFELRKVIGRGGMGVVYEAYERSLQRKVALKVLPLAANGNEVQIRRFKNEAQAAANIDHPHIVPVYSIGENEGLHYYSMQLIEGPSLAMLLEQLRAETVAYQAETTAVEDRAGKETKCEAPPQDTADRSALAIAGLTPDAKLHVRIRSLVELGIQAAEALHAAHEQGIVHRDVKPSNLLLSSDGKLWVSDFGLARYRNQQSDTRTGDILGTMRYMSPEQAQGKGELIDHRADIFSLGVTLYELITLRHPTGHITDAARLFDREPSPPRPLRYWNKRIPQDLQTIVMKAMAANPSERYRTAQEFADDLQRFLDGLPVRATPPSVLNRASKWARRHRVLVGSAAMIALVAVVGQSLNNVILAIKNDEIVQKNEEINEALAVYEQSLHRALDVLDRLGTRTVDQLEAIPGAEGVRLALLEDSLDFYKEFEAEVAGMPRLSESLARVYGNRAALDETLRNSGDALERTVAARDLWQECLDRAPNDANLAGNLAMANNRLALLQIDQGQHEQASATLDQAEQVVRKHATPLPADAPLHADLAATYSNRGLLAKASGDTDLAAKYFRQAIDLQRELIDLPEVSNLVTRSLAASYNNLASLSDQITVEAAEDAYCQAIKMQRRLVEGDPVNRLYQGELARSFNNLGYLQAQGEQWTTAQRSYQSAIVLQQHLVEVSPLALKYRGDLAVSLNNLGMVQSHAGDFDAAKESFEQAFRMQRALLNAGCSDAKLLSDLGGVCNNLGLLFAGQQKFSKAEAAFHEAVEYQRKAYERAPQASRYRELLIGHYTNYANCLLSQMKNGAADALLHDRDDLVAVKTANANVDEL